MSQISHGRFDFTPPFVAHRGASACAPENTMPAFVKAATDGAQWLEATIKLTQDGVPVVFFDNNLERTTNGSGALSDIAWPDLQKLDAGLWFGAEFAGTRVPAMAELIAFARDKHLRLNLELKPSPGRTRVTTMVTLIEVAKSWPDTLPPPLISSCNTDALEIAAQLHPALPRALILEDWREDWRDLMFKTHAIALSLNEKLLTPERLSLLGRVHTPLLAFTVNNAERAHQLLSAGVRALICDDPGNLLTQFQPAGMSRSQ